MFDNLKSLDLDVAVISETRISRKHTLEFIFEAYEILSPCGLSGTSSNAALIFWKSFDTQVQIILLNPDGKVVALNINGSEGGTFRLVATYIITKTGRSDFFRRLETFLRISCTLVLVGIGIFWMHGRTMWVMYIVEMSVKASKTCPKTFSCLADTDWNSLMCNGATTVEHSDHI